MLLPFIWREGWAAFRCRAAAVAASSARPVFAHLRGGGFYWALADMSLADVMTFYLAGPIYVTAMSPFLLGEQVGWRRWAAVVRRLHRRDDRAQPDRRVVDAGGVCRDRRQLGVLDSR